MKTIIGIIFVLILLTVFVTALIVLVKILFKEIT